MDESIIITHCDVRVGSNRVGRRPVARMHGGPFD